MPVLSAAFQGAEESLIEAGANVRLIHMPDLSRLPNDLRIARLDGLILTGAMVKQFGDAIDTPAVKQLKTCRRSGSSDNRQALGDAVVADDFAVGVGAAEHLVANGHRQLAS